MATAGSRLRTTSGAPVALADRLGGGGEGAVYAVRGRPDAVAKIYKAALTQERGQKLEAMIGASAPALLRITAWPTDLVLAGGSVVGFLMPRAVQAEEAHVLYGPKSRKQKFPDAGYKFLVHAAMNVARAFAVVHQHGIVVGDVNERVAMIAHDGTVRLIDCDSFQIRSAKRVFRCEVGVPLFTPPELQSVPSLRGLERTEQHDLFGLAVLIFHLLFLGRHPYSGRDAAQPDMTIETAIKEHRFAYSVDRHRTGMALPASSPTLLSAGADIARLFEEAFAPAAATGTARRPAAAQWADVLEALQATLADCKENAAHAYAASLPACPWCAIELASGIELFNYVEPAGAAGTPVDIEAIWRAIHAMPLLEPPPLPDPGAIKDGLALSPNAQIVDRIRKERERVEQAAAARAAAELEVEARNGRVQAAEAAIAQARAHLAAFEDDEARVPELERRHQGAKATLQRYRQAQYILVLLAAASAGTFAIGRPLGAVICALTVCAAILFWDVRARKQAASARIAHELDALRASVALGAGHRKERLEAAELGLEAARQALIAAQGEVYQAMLRETEAMAAARAPPPGLEAAQAAIEARFRDADLRHRAILARHAAVRQDVARLRPALATRRDEAVKACAEVRKIEARREGERRRARERAREEQLDAYLDQFFILRESWRGRLPKTVLAALSSFGIETAADITPEAVEKVPGVGAVRAQVLLDWRRQKEAGFRFDPGKGSDAALVAADRRLGAEKRTHERALKRAFARLEALAAEPSQRHAAIEKELADSARALAQALKDMEALGRDAPGGGNAAAAAKAGPKRARRGRRWRP
jgi:DNA-binding helix-hairpin-helix protein with protein kinase domain